MKYYGRFDATEALASHGGRSTIRCGDIVLKRFTQIEMMERERLRSRGRALMNLEHPGLARCLEVVEDEDSIAFVYQWVDGTAVGTLIDQGVGWSEPDLFQCIRECAEALQHAHTADPPVLHRDVKPDNVVWREKHFVIIDFDAAREFVDTAGNVSVIGTTGYAGPEQFIGRADPRSDQYGIATTVVHMASMVHPTELPLVNLRLDISSVLLSDPLREILNRMLSPNVDDRFADMSAVIDAVDRGTALTPVEFALAPLRDFDSIVTHVSTEDADVFEIAYRFRRVNFGIAVAVMCFGIFFTATWLSQGMIWLSIWSAIYAWNEWSHRYAAKIVVSESGWVVEHRGLTHSGDRVPMLRIDDAVSNNTLASLVATRASLKLNDIKINSGFLPTETRALRAALQDAFEARFGKRPLD